MAGTLLMGIDCNFQLQPDSQFHRMIARYIRQRKLFLDGSVFAMSNCFPQMPYICITDSRKRITLQRCVACHPISNAAISRSPNATQKSVNRLLLMITSFGSIPILLSLFLPNSQFYDNFLDIFRNLYFYVYFLFCFYNLFYIFFFHFYC